MSATYGHYNTRATVAFNIVQQLITCIFTSDNSQPANVYVDYAVIGAANVQARVMQISPVSGADSYVEIKPLSSGTLAPLTVGSKVG